MSGPIRTLLRSATRKSDEPLNCLTFPTHERWQTGLAKTGHMFYLWQGEHIKTWNSNYGPLPDNHILLNPALKNDQIPTDVDIDVVLSQNKAGQFQQAIQIARYLHCPLISIEHTLPMPQWPTSYVKQLKSLSGDVNVFISEYNRRMWGFEEKEALVVHHGIDSELFCPDNNERKSHILSVVNDWKNRDWCCGFKIWERVTRGLPTRPVGDTPGLSKPAPSIPDLVKEYQQAQVFINTSTVSPVPTALLEAMACGCAIVSTANCMIPEIIEHGKNGLISNDENELRGFCQDLLKDHTFARTLGQRARETIEKRFSMAKFVEGWNKVFRHATSFVYTGE